MQNSNKITQILIIFLISLTSNRYATASIPVTSSSSNTYYVDLSHPNASDGNPGTETLPWLTIQHAADVLSAGETVIIKPGFYSERVIPQTTGELGKMITFQASPAKSVTMWGFNTVHADYLRIEGFNITTDISLIGWDEKYGIFIHSDYVEVVNNYFFNLTITS